MLVWVRIAVGLCAAAGCTSADSLVFPRGGAVATSDSERGLYALYTRYTKNVYVYTTITTCVY